MTLTEQLRHLADVVERVEERTDLEVQDAGLDGVSLDGDVVRCRLQILAPMDADEADAPEPEPDETFECGVDGCEFTSESERGLAIHTGRTHKDENEDEEPVEATEDDDRVDEEEAGIDPFLTAAGKRRDGHSTEDDGTSLSEADVEPEAPHDDDLEEQAADDGAEDNGDDVQDEDDDVEINLPDGVTHKKVLTVVGESETLGDVADQLDITRGHARAITVRLGCYGDVRDVPKRGGRA